MKDLVFWFPSADPYYVDRFNALHKRGNVDFEVWYAEMIEVGRSWQLQPQHMNFPYSVVPALGLGNVWLSNPSRQWARTRPRVLVTHHGNPHLLGSLAQHVLPARQLVYYVENTYDTWFPRSLHRELTKSVLFNSADAFLSAGRDADAYIAHYTRRQQPIFRLNHVINREHFAKARPLRDSEVSSRRRLELGLSGTVFLNIGRMWKQKGIGTLLDAFQEISNDGADCSLLLVGDGVDRSDYVNLVESKGLKSVRFMDFVQQEDLPGIYALGHVFVFPTRGDPYGLVVDEAMAAGMPVISTDYAGEIRDRVVENETGFIVQLDDRASLKDAMMNFLRQPELIGSMGANAAGKNADRSWDTWAEQVENFLASIG